MLLGRKESMNDTTPLHDKDHKRYFHTQGCRRLFSSKTRPGHQTAYDGDNERTVDSWAKVTVLSNVVLGARLAGGDAAAL